MMKKTLLITSILLVGFCLNSQTLNDILERKNKAVSVIKDLKSAKDEISNATLELTMTLNNKTIIATSSLISKPCGENESIAENNLNLNIDGVLNESVFRFYDNQFSSGPCNLFTSNQYQTNEKLETDTSLYWGIGFLPKPKENSLYVFNKFTKNFTNNFYKNEIDKKNHFNIVAYKLINDSVFVYKVNNDSEFKTHKRQFFMSFKDGEAKDRNGDLLFNYKGKNIFSIMKIYFATLFYFKEFQFAKEQQEILVKRNNEIIRKNDEIEQKRINENLKISAAEWEAKEKQYLTKSKNCKYCNVKYTGVSFGIKPHLLRKDAPCKSRIDEVYWDAFCSRKCVLDHCNSTN
jgi:hypothetical protein